MNDFIMAVLEKSCECLPLTAEGSGAAALYSEYEQLTTLLHSQDYSEEVRRLLEVCEKLRKSERKAIYLGSLITGITLHKALSAEHQDSLLALCEQELIKHGYRHGKSE